MEEKNTGKRPYTMTEAALEQRKKAAALSTGPRTEDGKAASSRNAWKHGEFSALNRLHLQNAAVIGAFGKPCKTTCPKYPDNNPEYPCSLVIDGLTKAGGDCLDKAVYVDAFTSIIDSLRSGDFEAVNSMAASQVAGAVEILQKIRDELSEHGLMIEVDVYNKTGDVVGTRLAVNPLLPHYHKMLQSLGISLPEMMATPKARKQIVDPDDPSDPVRTLFEGLAAASRNVPKPVTIEGERNGDE